MQTPCRCEIPVTTCAADISYLWRWTAVERDRSANEPDSSEKDPAPRPQRFYCGGAIRLISMLAGVENSLQN